MGTRRERSRSPGRRVEHLAHRRVFVLSRCRRLRGHPNDGRRCLEATRKTATRVERGLFNGPQLYSVAMILEQEGLLDGAELLGTDCRADAIWSAREGVFERDHVANLDSRTRDRYFERTCATWRIASSLRNHTRWQVADATRVKPPGIWDLVLCRNLVIYLREPAGRTLLQDIASALAPGGFLVVGRAERPPDSRGLRAVGTCTYQNNVIA